jgi:integrase
VASEVQRVKGAKRLGVRTGNWLAHEQAQQLLALPDRNTLCGKRDSALLSLLLGAGLRRDELAQLRIEDLQQREGRWCLVDIQGKGKRVRTVPIPVWTKEAVDVWLQAVPFQSGLVLGKVNKGGRFVGQGMTAAAIYGVVVRYEKILQVKVKPHDLRRTFGKLAHQGGARIEQIQRSYGHATIQTTERYLGVEQDLIDAPCDHLRLAPPSSTDGALKDPEQGRHTASSVPFSSPTAGLLPGRPVGPLHTIAAEASRHEGSMEPSGLNRHPL